jgi:hypothetical protein
VHKRLIDGPSDAIPLYFNVVRAHFASRAVQPGIPDDGVLGFGIDLAQAVGGRLTTKEIKQSSKEKLAGPNLFPVIAASVGSTVYERSLPVEKPDLAIAAAGRSLDEWPDAEIVAVLVGAAIRENGERVDVLGVTVQRTGASTAVSVIQRYKTAEGGGIELFGPPTVMPTTPFLQPRSASASHETAPDATLVTLINDAAARIAKYESHAKAHTDPSKAIGSPEALICKPDDTITMVVFAMQGPITAAGSCMQIMKKDEFASAKWVAFAFDDLSRVNGVPDRRMRICVCRRGDSATAFVDQRYEGIETDGGFRVKGRAEFKRWGPALMSTS